MSVKDSNRDHKPFQVSPGFTMVSPSSLRMRPATVMRSSLRIPCVARSAHDMLGFCCGNFQAWGLLLGEFHGYHLGFVDANSEDCHNVCVCVFSRLFQLEQLLSERIKQKFNWFFLPWDMWKWMDKVVLRSCQSCNGSHDRTPGGSILNRCGGIGFPP